MGAVSTAAMWMQLGGSGGGFFGGFPFMIIMVVVLFAVMILPNQRKQKQWTAMLAQLKVGDRVTTNGGLRGTVFQVKDDAVVVKTFPDNVKLEVVKSSIAAVTTEEKSSE